MRKGNAAGGEQSAYCIHPHAKFCNSTWFAWRNKQQTIQDKTISQILVKKKRAGGLFIEILTQWPGTWSAYTERPLWDPLAPAWMDLILPRNESWTSETPEFRRWCGLSWRRHEPRLLIHKLVTAAVPGDRRWQVHGKRKKENTLTQTFTSEVWRWHRHTAAIVAFYWAWCCFSGQNLFFFICVDSCTSASFAVWVAMLSPKTCAHTIKWRFLIFIWNCS